MERRHALRRLADSAPASQTSYRVLEAGYTMQIPQMFAPPLLVWATRVMIFLVLSLSVLSYMALRR